MFNKKSFVANFTFLTILLSSNQLLASKVLASKGREQPVNNFLSNAGTCPGYGSSYNAGGSIAFLVPDERVISETIKLICSNQKRDDKYKQQLLSMADQFITSSVLNKTTKIKPQQELSYDYINDRCVSVKNDSNIVFSIWVKTVVNKLLEFTEIPYSRFIEDTNEWLSSIEGSDLKCQRNDNILTISFKSFSSSLASDVGKLLDSLNVCEQDTLIFDVSRNSGGFMSSAINLANKFLTKNDTTIISLTWKTNNKVYYVSENDQPYKFRHIYFLISEESASATEILISALHYNLGRENVTLVGESHTEGKKYVGKYWIFENHGVSIITGEWFSPDFDQLTPGIGFLPDIRFSTDDPNLISKIREREVMATK
jgi:hypothetical protein